MDLDYKIFGVEIFDKDFFEMLLRFTFNILISVIIIYFNYHKHHKNSQYTFTFFVFNILIFFLSYMMASVKLELGFAFGLFAIFSILRYRTDPIPIKEMTYLFVVITVAVINAITTRKVSYFELFFCNFAIVFMVYYMEKLWFKAILNTMVIDYPDLRNVHKERHDMLLQDLKNTTGLDVQRFNINSVDFKKGHMKIKLFYKGEADS